MEGLKRVTNRRVDGLSAIRWDRLEALLAEYYAGEGYQVEHVGTGGSAKRFDGGIDLKLRKEDQYVLVQCKGWNVYQVPHNEVHQLIGGNGGGNGVRFTFRVGDVVPLVDARILLRDGLGNEGAHGRREILLAVE